MRISGIIPARFASSRFPGKPLIDLEGKTMIQRVYEQAAASGVFSELIVATDDVRIADAVNLFGGRVVMTDANLASGTDRCAAVAATLTDTEVVINIQGDEPLLEPQQIAALAGLFEEMPDLSIGSLAQQLSDHADLLTEPHWAESTTLPLCDAVTSVMWCAGMTLPAESLR